MKNDPKRFAEKVSEYNGNAARSGIGTPGEKCLHSIIKNYYDDNVKHQEVSVSGFIADIKNGEKIIEVQTRGFNVLNKKLEKYLSEYKVTVVYPVPHVKNVVWIDPETGCINSKNKSPKCGTGIEFLYEASRIRKHLNNPNLSFEILLIDIDEYRLQDGYGKYKKARCTKLDKKPVLLYDTITIGSATDVKKILPFELANGRFKYAEFEKITKLKGRRARYSLNALMEYGIVKPVDTDGKAIIYETNV